MDKKCIQLINHQDEASHLYLGGWGGGDINAYLVLQLFLLFCEVVIHVLHLLSGTVR